MCCCDPTPITATLVHGSDKKGSFYFAYISVDMNKYSGHRSGHSNITKNMYASNIRDTMDWAI